ncbi:MAG: cysteine desulfurase family protein [Rickettsiales bacterium]
MTRIFFDHNSTTNILSKAREAFDACLSEPHNPSSIHSFGRASRQAIEDAKKKILASLNLSSLAYEVIFTSSGTEANNLAINGVDCEEILISNIEHLSILEAAKHSGKSNIIISVDKNGLIDLDELEQKVQESDSKKLISIIYANNETGVIQNIREIANVVKKHNCLIHSDCSQAYGKIKLDLSDCNLDAITISGHKIGAHQGVAAIIKKKSLNLKPLMHGGGQEFGIRPGTENVPAICGLGAIANDIIEINNKYSGLASLRNLIEDELKSASDNVEFLSEKVDRLPNTSSICFNGIDNNLILIQLDLAGFAVSAGSACSSGKIEPSYVIKAMTHDVDKAKNTIRVSLGLDNTKEQIKKFIDTCKEIIEKQNSNIKMRA